MAAGQLIIPEAMPSRDSNGRAVSSRLYFYQNNTTIPQAVYDASDLATPISQPVLASAEGRWPEIWANTTNTFTVAWTTNTGQPIKTYKGIKAADNYVVYDDFADDDLGNVTNEDFRGALARTGVLDKLAELDVVRARLVALCRRVCGTETVVQGSCARDVPCILDYVGGTYGGDPTGTHSSSVAVRAFLMDCRDAGAIGDLSGRTGIWALDHDVPILIAPNSGMAGPRRPNTTLSWTQSGSDITSSIKAPGCTFLIDVKGPNRNVPKFAMQGQCSISNCNFIGADLLADRTSIDVGAYPTITGGPTKHAPVIVTDHLHNDDGTLAAAGKAKAGSILLENLTGIGLYDFLYMGDGLVGEEETAWGQYAFSGYQTGTGGIIIDGLRGCVLHRVLGWSRIAAGGLRVRDAQFTPPFWTGISQSVPAGPLFTLAKWQQRNGVFGEGRHRSVGIKMDGVALRGLRHGFRFYAGTVTGSPGGHNQDTGKINQSYFKGISCERVCTVAYFDPYSYMHATTWEVEGHFKDGFDANNNENLFQIDSDGALAGVVDKAWSTPYLPSHNYLQGDKVNNGGRIYVCKQAGLTPSSGPGPVGTVIGVGEDVGTTKLAYSGDAFKESGNYIGWRNKFSLDLQQCAGAALANTSADPHVFYQYQDLTAYNWQMGDPSKALIINNSARAVVQHVSGVIQANGASSHVYHVTDAGRLDIGVVRFAGCPDIPVDADGLATGAIPPTIVNVAGVDFGSATITSIGTGTIDDSGDGDDGEYGDD